MHADSRREKIMNNILQNLNTISISIVTGEFLAAFSFSEAYGTEINVEFECRGHIRS